MNIIESFGVKIPKEFYESSTEEGFNRLAKNLAHVPPGEPFTLSKVEFDYLCRYPAHRPDGRPDFGPSVKDGTLCYVSASSIQAFDTGTYGGCHRRFYITRVLGIKEATTGSQKIGTEGHAQNEHYLKTGEDVLGPFSRAGKHLLPKPGPDLEIEQGLASEHGTALAIAFRLGALAEKREPHRSITTLAGLSAAGVPVVGYIDLQHRRGEYVDESGVLRPEADPKHTAEILDHKFSSDISTYGKSAEEIVDGVQMTSYTVCAANAHPDLRFVRNSHLYFQTRGAKTAKKITKLVVIAEARKRWEAVEATVKQMILDAAKPSLAEVSPYSPSCDAYRGCPHKGVNCDHTPDTSIRELVFRKGGTPMTASQGLFASLMGKAPPEVPDLPAASALPDAVRKAAAKAQLEAEDALGACGKCKEPLSPANASRLKDGTVKHIGCKAAINPPDGPAANLLTGADALPPEVIAALTNPDLKARAEAHAAEHAAKAAAEAAKKAVESPPKSGGRCPQGGVRVQLTQEQAGSKKYPCTCGKVLAIRPSADYKEATLAGHLMPKKEDEAAPVESAPELPEIPDVPDAPPTIIADSDPLVQRDPRLKGAVVETVTLPPGAADAPPLPPEDEPQSFATEEGEAPKLSHLDEAKALVEKVLFQTSSEAGVALATLSIAHSLIAIAEKLGA